MKESLFSYGCQAAARRGDGRSPESSVAYDKKGGAATLLGIFEKPDGALPVNTFVHREISLGGSQGYCWDFQDSLSLLESGSVDLCSLITHRLALADIQKGFDLSMEPGANSLKVVLIPESA